jgi:hypothetical protein
MFRGLAVRFVNVQRAPKFTAARPKLARYALSPSGIFGDTSVWTTMNADGSRALTLAGTIVPNGYLFTPRASVPLPSAPGDARHFMGLRKLADSEYEWTTDVDHAMGSVHAADVAAAMRFWMGAHEGRTEREIRDDYREAFPRTSRQLGQLCSLDSVHVTAVGDGTTALTLGIRINSNGLKPGYPNFAQFVHKYVDPSRYHVTLRDRAGTYLDVVESDAFVTIRMRTRGGALYALSGAPHPMPDSVQITTDFYDKFKIFTVGMSELVGDFIVGRTEHERAWTMRWRREPDWHFPLSVNTFMRSSLRRPFEKGGTLVWLAVRDSVAGQAQLSRHIVVPVKESAIVRWLGALGNSAMSDFEGRVELEENRFLSEALMAIRADMMALLLPGCRARGGMCDGDDGAR